MKAALLLVLLSLCAAPAAAELRAVPERGDPRIATLRWSASEPGRLEVPLGSEVTVLLPAGDRLSALSVAAPGDWQVTTLGAGESFSIRALRPVPDTTLAVITAQRTFQFILSAPPSTGAPLIVKLTGVPAPPGEGTSRASGPAPDAAWRLSGNRELWPSQIRDDGRKTYLEWPADRPIPAVFALDRLGREEMVNGYMRGSIFTIDRVHERLLFRIDKAKAEARKRSEGGGR